MPSYTLEVTSRVSAAHAIEVVASQGVITGMSVAPEQSGVAFLRRFERWGAIIVADSIPMERSPPLRVTVEVDRTAEVAAEVVGNAGVNQVEVAPTGQPIHWQTLRALEHRSIQVAFLQDRNAAAYFAAMDAATHPVLLDERQPRTRYVAGLKALIEHTGQGLLGKLVARLTSMTPPSPPPPPALALFSRLQRDLFQEHFHGTADFAASVLDAYARFGAGNLFLNIEERGLGVRRRLSNGGPNSANVFLFGEFALESIRTGVDAALWKSVLSAMLVSSELYLAAYADYDGGTIRKRPIHTYDDRPRRRVSDQSRRTMMDVCSMLNPDQIDARLTTLAQSAFLPPAMIPPPLPTVHESCETVSGCRCSFPARLHG